MEEENETSYGFERKGYFSPAHVLETFDRGNLSLVKSFCGDITSPMKNVERGGEKVHGSPQGSHKNNDRTDRLEKSLQELGDN